MSSTINGVRSNQVSESVGDGPEVHDKKPIRPPKRHTDMTHLEQADTRARGGGEPPPTFPNTASEEGHAPTKTQEQIDFETRTQERNAIIKGNAEIAESNRKLNEQIALSTTVKGHLEQLAMIGDLSASFTRGELNDFTNSATLSPEIKAAARWLLSQSDADLAALGLRKGEGGVTKESINIALAALEVKIPALQAQLRPETPVPGEPPRPNSAPNPSTGGTDGPSPGSAGSPAPANSAPPKPTETREQLEARVFANLKKVPPFHSDAPTAEGRMEDAVMHLQDCTNALNDDLVAATMKDPPNQGEIMMIQQRMQALQNALSALMEMQKQRHEMQSNMSKMFNEMAMTSIRNMR